MLSILVDIKDNERVKDMKFNSAYAKIQGTLNLIPANLLQSLDGNYMSTNKSNDTNFSIRKVFLMNWPVNVLTVFGWMKVMKSMVKYPTMPLALHESAILKQASLSCSGSTED